VPLIEIEKRRVRYAVLGVGMAVLIFIGHLLLGEDTVATALVVSIGTGLLWVAFIAWMEQRAARNKSREPTDNKHP
jgi:hypothetical protein